jgi:hypothetical protein
MRFGIRSQHLDDGIVERTSVGQHLVVVRVRVYAIGKEDGEHLGYWVATYFSTRIATIRAAKRRRASEQEKWQ